MTSHRIKEIYALLQPYCIAIYLGGSRVNKYIDNPHDYDYILFVDDPVNKCHIRRILHRYLNSKNKNSVGLDDFIQIREKNNEEHSYGSFINKLQKKLIGEDIDFKFDIIYKDREEYKKILKDTVYKLKTGKILNKKRWYQVYQGISIMKNNSYNMSDEQKRIINILHDQKEEEKEMRKQIIDNLIQEVESWPL